METLGSLGVCGSILLFIVGVLAIRFNYKGLRTKTLIENQNAEEYIKMTDNCFLSGIAFLFFAVLLVVALVVVL